MWAEDSCKIVHIHHCEIHMLWCACYYPWLVVRKSVIIRTEEKYNNKQMAIYGNKIYTPQPNSSELSSMPMSAHWISLSHIRVSSMHLPDKWHLNSVSLHSVEGCLIPIEWPRYAGVTWVTLNLINMDSQTMKAPILFRKLTERTVWFIGLVSAVIKPITNTPPVYAAFCGSTSELLWRSTLKRCTHFHSFIWIISTVIVTITTECQWNADLW